MIKKSSITDTGNVRKRNEDSFVEESFNINGQNVLLLVVADGMGGHRAGDVASQIVTDTIKDYVYSSSSQDYPDILENSLREANKQVLSKSAADPQYSGMGSTCTALMLICNEVYLAHAGDSRAYRISNGSISLLTTDHTVAEEMRIRGNLTQKDARTLPQRHILTNAVGIKNDIRIDILGPLKLEYGDSYVLCSDGLSEHLEDHEIEEITKQNTPEDACKLLLDLAKERGGSDNITIQILKSDDTGT